MDQRPNLVYFKDIELFVPYHYQETCWRGVFSNSNFPHTKEPNPPILRENTHIMFLEKVMTKISGGTGPVGPQDYYVYKIMGMDCPLLGFVGTYSSGFFMAKVKV